MAMMSILLPAMRLSLSSHRVPTGPRVQWSIRRACQTPKRQPVVQLRLIQCRSRPVSLRLHPLASGSSEFRVVRGYWIVFIVGLFLIVVFGVVFYLWRIEKREKMLERVVRRLKRNQK